MKLIAPADSMFLLGESREHPMHVGSLQLFQPPDGVDEEFVTEAYESMLGCTDVQPTFRKHPAFFGPLTEGLAVWRGGWQYTVPDILGIPIWLPVGWAMACLLLKRLAESATALVQGRSGATD